MLSVLNEGWRQSLIATGFFEFAALVSLFLFYFRALMGKKRSFTSSTQDYIVNTTSMKFGSSNNKVHEMILPLNPPQPLLLLFGTQPSFTTFEQNLTLHLHVFWQLAQLQKDFLFNYHIITAKFFVFFSLSLLKTVHFSTFTIIITSNRHLINYSNYSCYLFFSTLFYSSSFPK